VQLAKLDLKVPQEKPGLLVPLDFLDRLARQEPPVKQEQLAKLEQQVPLVPQAKLV
jgi:hypothetical protein